MTSQVSNDETISLVCTYMYAVSNNAVSTCALFMYGCKLRRGIVPYFFCHSHSHSHNDIGNVYLLFLSKATG